LFAQAGSALRRFAIEGYLRSPADRAFGLEVLT
jgi:hypothetical protein